MDIKKILIIIVFIIGIAIAINTIVTASANSIEVNGTHFTLPEGYKCTANDKYAIITNGAEKLNINCYDTTDIQNLTDSYVDYNAKHNLSITITTSNIDNTEIYKSTMDSNPKIIHYWFVHNNKVYHIYSQTATSNTENVVNSLIKSCN